jgi:hypothetical protein
MLKIKIKIAVYILSSLLLLFISIITSQYFINQVVEIYDGQKEFFELLAKKEKIYNDIMRFQNKTIEIDKSNRDFFYLKDGKAKFQDDLNSSEDISDFDTSIKTISTPLVLHDYKIAFIIVKGDTKVAMINSKMYNEGDAIGIEKITKIEPKRILLETATTKRWIKF